MHTDRTNPEDASTTCSVSNYPSLKPIQTLSLFTAGMCVIVVYANITTCEVVAIFVTQ